MANFEIIRRTAAQWTAGNYTLLANQLGVESSIVNSVEVDTGKAKLGDGVTTWANLPYFSPNASTAGPASSTSGDIATFSGATGKVLQDGGMSLPASSGTVGYLNIPANSKSADYTTVLADSGKSIDHPATDANARTFTIAANASVAYPIGTAISFSNMDTNTLTIAITTDTLYLAGAGTTGSRSLAQYGTATARKLTTTTWIISGVNLT